MPLIPLPSTSYPVDSNLLYEIIRGINTLSDAVSKSAGTSYINGKSVPTNALQIVTSNVPIVNNQDVKSGDTRSFSFEYSNFSEIPNVVATPVISGANLANRGISVILTVVTTTKASGFVRFGESGITTVNLNLTATGISPTYKR